MRKIKFILFPLVLLFAVAFTGTLIRANTPETVNVALTSVFDGENTVSQGTVSRAYGSKFSFDSNVESGLPQDYTFAYWVVNGAVRPDLPIDHEFTITTQLELVAVFSPVDKHTVLFMDSNGKLLKTAFVANQGTASDDGITLPSKPGYTVKTGEAKWNAPLTDITSDTVFILQYEKDATDLLTLVVNNGTGDSEEYEYNEVVTAVADAPVGGLYFSHWEENGKKVSSQSEYSFTMLTNREITAVYSETEPTDLPFVSISDDLSLRAGYRSYLGQFYVPDGYDYIEHGIITTKGSGTITFETSNVNIIQSNKFFASTKEYLMSFTMESHSSARAYLIVKQGEAISIVYSDLVAFNEIPLTVTEIWDAGFSTSHLVFTDVELIGVVAATTDRGYIVQDIETADMISVHDTTNQVTKGDKVFISGQYNVSFNIARIVSINEFQLISSNSTINYSVTNAISVNFDDFVTSDYLGKLIRVDIPWAKAYSGDTSYIRLAGDELGLESKMYDNKYLGLQNGANNPNLATTLSTYFGEGTTNTRYFYEIFVFLYDSSADYNKAVIIGDEHINSIDTYTLTFDSKEGSVVSSQVIVEGRAATEPPSPTKIGYSFDGWYTSQDDGISLDQLYNFSTPVVSDLTLYAKWNVVPTYTVTFEDNGADASVSSQTVNENDYAIEPNPAPSKEGHIFGGWFSDIDLLEEFNFQSTPITSDITIYAKWDEVLGNYETVTITTSTADGTYPTSYGPVSWTLNDITFTGNVFTRNGSTVEYTIQGNKTQNSIITSSEMGVIQSVALRIPNTGSVAAASAKFYVEIADNSSFNNSTRFNFGSGYSSTTNIDLSMHSSLDVTVTNVLTLKDTSMDTPSIVINASSFNATYIRFVWENGATYLAQIDITYLD